MMARFIILMQPIHQMRFMTLIILVAYLVHLVTCTPMPNEDDQQLALPLKIDPDEGEAETKRNILEDLQSKVQFGRHKDVNMRSIFEFSKVNEMSPLNKMLGKELINIIMDQTREAFLELNISMQCKEDFSKTINASLASETWALRMADAAGKLGSGVLMGNVYWFGSYDECLGTNPTEEDKNNKTIQLFRTQYVVTYFPLPGSLVPLQWGSCVSDSCSAGDVTEVVQKVLSDADINIKGLSSAIKDETFPLDGPAIGMITFLSVLLVVLIVATGYDIIIYQPMLEQEKEQQEPVVKDSSSGILVTGDSDRSTILRVDEHTPLLSGTQPIKAPFKSADISFLAKALVKISMYSNAAKILHTGENADSTLRSVHGVRLASMSWVILTHTYFFALTNTQNLVSVLAMVKQLAFEALMNSSVSVDSFFLISGLLMSYRNLNKMRNKGGPRQINWIMFYVHRIWRLTPAYMVVLAAYTILYKYTGNGPAWPGEVPEPHCKDYWWTNLLYINNIYKSDIGCMSWTWYLANDMQFYIISPIILIPLYLHFRAGLLVTLTLMVISFTCTGVLSAQNGLPPGTPGAFIHLDKMVLFFQKVYMVPWGRIGPYLVGILVGYVLYRTDRKVTLKWYTVAICWLLAIGMNLLILYGLYDVANGAPISNDMSALYNAVHRTLWACGVGWVIFACVTGYGGPVNTLLSWPAFIPFSRLTYMAYLVHPIIIQRFYQSMRVTVYLDVTAAIYLYLAHMVMSFGVAFVISLAIEVPFMGLEKLVFKT